MPEIPPDGRVARVARLRLTMIMSVIGLALVAFFGLTSGWTGALVFVGLYAIATGLWAVARGRGRAGRVSRPVGAALLGIGLIVTSVGAADSPVIEQLGLAGLTVDTDEVLAQAQPESALAAVALLEVKGRAPKTGYERDLFGSGWVDTDQNGCDTRNDMLSRDLEPQTYKPGTHDCVVLTGTLNDPFSGTTIEFTRGQTTSSDVQIDHVVALSDAWQKGAQQWDEAKRVAFANDPLNLLAVDGSLNQQKGDRDAATWLPPNKSFRCEYVARQVGVKVTYGLWVTAAERDAMVEILSGCPDEPLPASSATLPTRLR